MTRGIVIKSKVRCPNVGNDCSVEFLKLVQKNNIHVYFKT